MLTRALKQSSRLSNSLMNVSARTMITRPDKHWIVPESVEDVITYLDEKRPNYTCIYFHASWNPTCADIEKDYDNFTQ